MYLSKHIIMTDSLIDEQKLDLMKKELNGWECSKDSLIKELKFKDFIEAFAFITKLALIAESMNHHPEWSNVYSQVTIKLTTHDLGGVSELDVKLANAIDRIL